jgi:hypothetical protein
MSCSYPRWGDEAVKRNESKLQPTMSLWLLAQVRIRTLSTSGTRRRRVIHVTYLQHRISVWVGHGREEQIYALAMTSTKIIRSCSQKPTHNTNQLPTIHGESCGVLFWGSEPVNRGQFGLCAWVQTSDSRRRICLSVWSHSKHALKPSGSNMFCQVQYRKLSCYLQFSVFCLIPTINSKCLLNSGM